MVFDCCNSKHECNCSCHHNKAIMHCVPCCFTCQYCRARIRRTNIERHEEECKKKYGKLNNE